MPMNATLIRTPVPDPRHRREAIAERILPADLRRGRGAATNASGRFELQKREDFDDGWTRDDALEPLATEVTWEKPKAIITRNTSPDIGFDRSINPYRGCEHGCFYCYARPTHTYMGLSACLAKIPAGAHRLRRQHRSLSADRASVSHHPIADRDARARPSPAHHRHQI